MGFFDLPTQFREARREHRADYDAGRDNRYRRKRRGLDGGADAHYTSATTFYHIIGVSRDMFRNDVTKPLVQRCTQNVVRGGFNFEPQTGSNELDKLLYTLHTDWALDPMQVDESGVLTFPDYERLICDQELVDGDVFIHAPPDVSQIQMFESDQIRTPHEMQLANSQIIHGVQLGANRKRIRVYFARENGRYQYKLADLKPIAWYNADGTPRILQFYTPARVTQTRGVTHFHPVFDLIGYHPDINFTMLVKVQMGAALAWERRQVEPDAANDGPQLGPTTDTSMRSGDTSGTEIELQSIEPGAVVKSKYGQQLVMHNPNIVTADALNHLDAVLEQISLAIGIPLMLAKLDPSKGNFSAGRLILDQTKIGFMTRQDQLERAIHRPLTKRNIRRWLEEDSAAGAEMRRLVAQLPDARAVFNHVWHKPRWPYNQPLHDSQAQSIILGNYLNDPYAVAAENGRDADDIRDQTIKYRKSCIVAAIKASQEIEKETGGVKVPWEMVMGMASPNSKLMAPVEEEVAPPSNKSKS